MSKAKSIGIYGDSYADGQWGKPGDRFTCWPNELQHLLNCDGELYGRSGTSTYYSYEKFLDTYKKHDAIVFSYSSSVRWPVLPEGMEGHAYNYHQTSDTPVPKLAEYNKIFFDIFNENFLYFIDESIFRSVNRICQEENKYLINVFPFGDSYYKIPSTVFPVYLGLNDISWNEKVQKNGKIFNMFDLHTKENFRDHRYCHLSSKNNMFLAKTFKDAVEQKTMNLFCNLFKENNWIEFDELTAEMYKINP